MAQIQADTPPSDTKEDGAKRNIPKKTGTGTERERERGNKKKRY